MFDIKILIKSVMFFLFLFFYLNNKSLLYAQSQGNSNEILINRNNILQNQGYSCTLHKYPCPTNYTNLIDFERDITKYTQSLNYNTFRDIILSAYRSIPNKNSTTEGQVCINSNNFSRILYIYNNFINISNNIQDYISIINNNTFNGNRYGLSITSNLQQVWNSAPTHVFSPKGIIFSQSSQPSQIKGYIGFCKNDSYTNYDAENLMNGCCPGNFAATRYYWKATNTKNAHSIYNILDTTYMYNNNPDLSNNLVLSHPPVCCPIINIENNRLNPELYTEKHFSDSNVLVCMYNTARLSNDNKERLINVLNSASITLPNNNQYLFEASSVNQGLFQWQNMIQLALVYSNPSNNSPKEVEPPVFISTLSSELFYEQVNNVISVVEASRTENIPKTYCTPSNQPQQSCTLVRQQEQQNNQPLTLIDSYIFKNDPENTNTNKCERCYNNNDPVAVQDNKLIICKNGEAKSENLINNSISDTLSYLRARESLADDNSDLLQRCRERGGIFIFLGCIDTTPIGVITGLIRIALGTFSGLALLQMIQIGIIYQLGETEGNKNRIKKARERLINIFTGILILVFSTLIFRIIGVNILDILPSGSI